MTPPVCPRDPNVWWSSICGRYLRHDDAPIKEEAAEPGDVARREVDIITAQHQAARRDLRTLSGVQRLLQQVNLVRSDPSVLSALQSLGLAATNPAATEGDNARDGGANVVVPLTRMPTADDVVALVAMLSASESLDESAHRPTSRRVRLLAPIENHGASHTTPPPAAAGDEVQPAVDADAADVAQQQAEFAQIVTLLTSPTWGNRGELAVSGQQEDAVASVVSLLETMQLQLPPPSAKMWKLPPDDLAAVLCGIVLEPVGSENEHDAQPCGAGSYQEGHLSGTFASMRAAVKLKLRSKQPHRGDAGGGDEALSASAHSSANWKGDHSSGRFMPIASRGGLPTVVDGKASVSSTPTHATPATAPEPPRSQAASAANNAAVGEWCGQGVPPIVSNFSKLAAMRHAATHSRSGHSKKEPRRRAARKTQRALGDRLAPCPTSPPPTSLLRLAQEGGAGGGPSSSSFNLLSELPVTRSFATRPPSTAGGNSSFASHGGSPLESTKPELSKEDFFLQARTLLLLLRDAAERHPSEAPSPLASPRTVAIPPPRSQGSRLREEAHVPRWRLLRQAETLVRGRMSQLRGLAAAASSVDSETRSGDVLPPPQRGRSKPANEGALPDVVSPGLLPRWLRS